MILDAFGGAPAGASAAAPAARGPRRPPYSWWRPKRGQNIRAAHVEDPIAGIAATGLPVGRANPYERAGAKLKRAGAPLRGIGRTERRRSAG